MDCSNFWKLDKVDKIGISIILILSCLFSLFNCICYASFDTVLTPVLVSNLRLDIIGDTATTLDEERYYDIYEIPSYYGYNYNFVYSQPSNYTAEMVLNIIEFENLPSVPGVTGKVLSRSTVRPGNNVSIDYKLETKNKIYLCVTANGNGRGNFLDNLVVTTDYISNGFTDSINLLVENVSFTNIWQSFEKSLPFVLIVVLFGFGWWFFAHWVKELSKGREF